MWVTAFETEDIDFLVRIIEEEPYIPDYEIIDDKVLIYSKWRGDAEKEKHYYDGYLEFADKIFQSWIYGEDGEFDERILNPYYENGVKPEDFY